MAATRSSGGGAAQRGRPAASERAAYRPLDDSVPWWLRVVFVCHVCSVLLGHVFTVVREWIYFVDVCCSGFFATTRKNIRPLKPSQNEK